MTVAQDGSCLLTGAQSMALTGDIVVEDNAVLSWRGISRLRAMQANPQSIVLNGGVLDFSDFTTWVWRYLRRRPSISGAAGQ
ncbi:hypothetical protein ACNKHM_22295 [Shigella sonnei]